MKHFNWRLLLFGILLGIAIACLGFYFYEMRLKQTAAPAPVALPTAKLVLPSDLDRYFLAEMIAHQQDALTMSRTAIKRARHKELRALARNIFTFQSAEIKTMSELYFSWFSQAPTRSMDLTLMMDRYDLYRLKRTRGFDQEFLNLMIAHHKLAVIMSQMVKRSTGRPEIKTLADKIITRQTKEIEQMQQWLARWN